MWLAFIIHDWGYWGMKDMDGPGDNHPIWAATKILNWDLADYLVLEVLYHSRFMVRKYGREPSRLCWADKLGTAMMPSFLWAVLARLSGEGFIYIDNQKYEINKGKHYEKSIRGLVEFHKQFRRWCIREVAKHAMSPTPRA
jgi:hypothetical protein